MCEYFALNSFQRALKANLKLKCDFIFSKTILTQNIYSLVCANLSKIIV